MDKPGSLATGRNAPCPCGSGRRYKHCCGDETPLTTRDLAWSALTERRYGEAERLFRAALAENPDDLACLHQLGVTLRRRLRYRESLATLLDAAERTQWLVPQLAVDLARSAALLQGRVPDEAMPIDTPMLREQALALLAGTEAPSRPTDADRTAIVVLGMHRSGTSALTRVLALAGAALPRRLVPAYEENPRGFWESSDVVALNERLLDTLGGTWRSPPERDALKEDAQAAFGRDLATFLAVDFGGAATIVLKDPRMALLAPAWHAALRDCGYRPVYVVPVRDPLEVAQSLAARDGLPLSQGLALWHEYMTRIERFANAVPDCVFVRSGALLRDWRAVVRRIDDRLDLRLDARAAAAEIDAFLDPALHRQRAGASDWQAQAQEPEARAAHAAYDALLARCDAATEARVPFREDFARDDRSSMAFVLCIENNGIRGQALLLIESIRRWGGRHRDAPILAFSPRPGLAVDDATRARLATLGVRYVDEPLNTICREYGPANRVFAGAWAERHVDTDFLAVIDSDTVYLDEPQLARDADALVRPVDVKGSASAGPGDAFEPYWQALAALAGVPLERLPQIVTSVSGVRLRASYNGGLVVVRRSLGVLQRLADLFRRSVQARLRPYAGSGVDVHASTGHVGQAGSEWWGSSQAVLALALWAGDTRVREYSRAYNLPLHLIADDGAIAPQWRGTAPAHVHYHWLLSGDRYQEGLALLAQLGVPQDRLDWLARRLPLR